MPPTPKKPYLLRLSGIDDGFLRQGRNSIGFLRLVLAALVLLEHAFALAGFPQPGHLYAKLAVGGFFFLSGLLITQSYLHSKSAFDYIWRRTLRIYPGFWACLFVTALLIVPLAWVLQHGSLAGYFSSSPSPASYIARGIPMFGMRSTIGNVFAATPVGDIVNGSLWTLPVEYFCYVVLGLVGLVGVLKRKPWLLVLCAGVLYLLHVFPSLRIPSPHGFRLPTKLTDSNVLELYVEFALGSVVYLFRKAIRFPNWVGLISLVIMLGLICFESPAPVFQDASRSVRVLLLPVALLWLAKELPLKRFDQRMDLSYGTYIYAFPVQQTMVVAGFAKYGGWFFFASSFVITLCLAFLSWHLVERPALGLKRLFARDRRTFGLVTKDRLATRRGPPEVAG